MKSKFRSVCFAPVLAVLLPVFGGAASYAIAIMLYDETKHNARVLYPSDLFVSQPQRGIMSVAVGIGACLCSLTVFVRYIQLQSMTFCSRTNFISFTFGIAASFGQTSISAFSWEESLAVHFFIACCFFGSACMYLITQAYLTYRCGRFGNKQRKCSNMATFRIACTVIA